MADQILLIPTEENVRKYWYDRNEGFAKSDDMFCQMGRAGSMNFQLFLIFCKDIAKALGLQNNDSVLDVGGGTGWTSMMIAPYVKDVTLFDVVTESVQKAKLQTRLFSNIRVLQDDVLTMTFVKNSTYDKGIVSGVLVLLGSLKAVKKALINIHSVLKDGGKAIFTDNMWEKRWDIFVASFTKQLTQAGGLTPTQIKESVDAIRHVNLWFDLATIQQISLEIGFKKCTKVNILEPPWYFSFLLEK